MWGGKRTLDYEIDWLSCLKMPRLFMLSLFFLTACGSPSEPMNADQDIKNFYESSGTVFFISPEDLPNVEREAIAGDDEQLQRLIDYYSFSHIPQNDAAALALQRWQLLGAARGLKGATLNLLYSASQTSGPNCSLVREHAQGLENEDLKAIRNVNNYVKACLADLT